MIQPEIRRLHTPDAQSFAEYSPEDSTDFSFLVQIIVGPAGAPGEESFDLEIATPKRLAARLGPSGLASGRHLLIVSGFDREAIRAWIERAVLACFGRDWGEVAARLARIARWEFEDYQD